MFLTEMRTPTDKKEMFLFADEAVERPVYSAPTGSHRRFPLPAIHSDPVAGLLNLRCTKQPLIRATRRWQMVYVSYWLKL